MSTPVLPCTPEAVAHTVAEAARVLRRGGLVAFPTETVYGLGANALDPAAVARIFTAKGRPATNPLIVHVADRAAVCRVATAWPDEAAQLADRFWPGPLTLVLPRHPDVPDVVTGGGPTVAVRIPAHPIALRLLRECGLPLSAPSANRSTALSPTRAEHVLRDLDGKVDLILDGGPTPGGIESTVIDVTVRPARLLRPGLIDPAALEAVLGPIERVGRSASASEAALPSPGMLSRHYAPRATLECLPRNAAAGRVGALRDAGFLVGWLTCDPVEAEMAPLGVLVRLLPADPLGYAALLYASLHDLDAAGVDRIVVTDPPGGDAWLAIHDRLRRAAHP